MTLEARLIGYLLAALAMVFVVTTVLNWREAAQKLPQVEMQLAATLAAQETARRIREEVTKDYASEIERLRAAAARGPRVIRVCDAPPVSQPGSPAAGADDPGAAGGEFPSSAGRDIGPALYAEADRADTLAAQLRALQSWVSSSISKSR